MPYLNNTVPSREKLRELVQAAYRVMTSDSLGPIYAPLLERLAPDRLRSLNHAHAVL